MITRVSDIIITNGTAGTQHNNVKYGIVKVNEKYFALYESFGDDVYHLIDEFKGMNEAQVRILITMKYGIVVDLNVKQ